MYTHKAKSDTQILSTRKFINGIGENDHKNSTYIYACFEVLSQVLWLIDIYVEMGKLLCN